MRFSCTSGRLLTAQLCVNTPVPSQCASWEHHRHTASCLSIGCLVQCSGARWLPAAQSSRLDFNSMIDQEQSHSLVVRYWFVSFQAPAQTGGNVSPDRRYRLVREACLCPCWGLHKFFLRRSGALAPGDWKSGPIGTLPLHVCRSLWCQEIERRVGSHKAEARSQKYADAKVLTLAWRWLVSQPLKKSSEVCGPE